MRKICATRTVAGQILHILRKSLIFSPIRPVHLSPTEFKKTSRTGTLPSPDPGPWGEGPSGIFLSKTMVLGSVPALPSGPEVLSQQKHCEAPQRKEELLCTRHHHKNTDPKTGRKLKEIPGII